jgi:alpha-L-fucosidase 2
LGDGEQAWQWVSKALEPAYGMDMRYDGGGGVYPNLFDASPPFQIDGNFGETAAIAEMLVQSGSGEIRLLPALPRAWADGIVTGLRARGGFEISIMWKAGQLVSATIRSATGEPCRVSYAGQSVDLKTGKGNSIRLNGQLKQF